MPRSTDERDGDRPGPPPLPKRTAKRDLGYEVLPEEDEAHNAEYRRQRWGQSEDDREHRRRRQPRSRGKLPVVRALGIACCVAAPLQGAIAIFALMTVAGRLQDGNSRNKFVSGCLIVFGYLTQYYVRVAWSIWTGRGSEVNFKQCILASLGFGGLAAIVYFPRLGFLLVSDKVPVQLLLKFLTGALAAVAAMGIAGLAALAQEHYRRPTRGGR